ncbi:MULTISPECIES: MarR family winged helix-turn-helix transcriptional regulator [unclassified Leucobacter]|uniref:MarR family winged helix-turn-helix transcriptional regulator n=1 Tax=unclassified Leucobacter TaxID=2621730 RepID=UPI000620E4C9|nr:MarR family transcriptional regulator [Leucobacter sp. Ag1]KKI21737.1 MarR family transcriptional regulator [Leucobacter sp. Ag1]
MPEAPGGGVPDPIAANLYEVDSSDPRSELVDRSGLSPEAVAQIGRLMGSLSALRDVEQRVSDASQKYMRLSAQDMRALHYLIVAKNRAELATPGMLAAHLGISAASTTKLLNRLERGGHVVRNVHPADRRAFAIEVTRETEVSAMQTVGRQQAKRFHAAARLTGEERETVIRFLDDMAAELSLDGADWAGGEAEHRSE